MLGSDAVVAGAIGGEAALMGPMVDGLSNYSKGVNSRRWAAARESVECGRGGRRASRLVVWCTCTWAKKS